MGRLGSINRQVNDIFSQSGIFTPGASKHEAKEEARAAGADSWHSMGKELNIFSYATAEQYKAVWHQAARWIKSEFGIHDVAKMNGEHFASWLEYKIDTDGIAKGTFSQYAAAVEKFGVALERCAGQEQNFSSSLKDVRVYAQNVLSAEHQDRSYENPEAVISALSNPTSQLTARIQHEAGARIHEVGQIRSEKITDDGVLVCGKGGYKRELTLTPELKANLKKHLAANDGKFCLDYDSYRKDLKNACKEVGENYEISGSHGFRYGYAQKSFSNHLKTKTYLESLKTVSAELGHHRASITKHYLR